MAYVEVDSPIILDETGQDIKDELTAIKSAVQGLGTALGSDRALIDGSNIANPSAFRNNIGLGYSVSTQTYDGLTWTIIKLGNLYDMYTEITIPANTNAITWGSMYVYRNPNKSYYSLPIALTKKIVDVSCMDGSSDGFPVFYTNISSVYNSATTADVGHPTTTTRELTVRKYIRGYVS